MPAHLAAQLEDWLPSAAELVVPDGGGVLLHADLHDGHVLGSIAEGRFVPEGIIDLNRARIGHPLYELGPIWHTVARGDPAIMKAFLSAAGLPGSERPDFPRSALAWCLLSEGVGRRPMPLPSTSVRDLDELAYRSFTATS
jgi:aminoglycoside phosphotransferase (APT) family kinase protein